MVSRSSAEAEYHTLATTTSKLTWITQLIQDFDNISSSTATIYCDNKAAIGFHEQTKHIEIACHFARDKIQSGLIKLLLVQTDFQLTDILTKPLPRKTYSALLSKMAIINI